MKAENISQVLDNFRTTLVSIDPEGTDPETYKITLANVPNANLASSNNGLLWLFEKHPTDPEQEGLCKAAVYGWTARDEKVLRFCNITMEPNFTIDSVGYGDVFKSVESERRQQELIDTLKTLEDEKADQTYTEKYDLDYTVDASTSPQNVICDIEEGEVVLTELELFASNADMSKTYCSRGSSFYKRLPTQDAEHVSGAMSPFYARDDTSLDVVVTLGTGDNTNKLIVQPINGLAEEVKFKGNFKVSRKTFGE